MPPVAVRIDWIALVPVLVVGLTTLIGVFFTALLSYHNGKKADSIHVLVNSGMSKALADLASAQNEIRGLRDLVQALNQRVVGYETEEERQRGTAAAESARLPSQAVQAAQAKTPKTE